MDYQHMAKIFDNEPIDEKPKLDHLYFTTTRHLTKGYCYLMKLVLLSRNNEKLVELFDDYKNEINNSNSEGFTSLIFACLFCSIGVIKKLIDMDANVNAKTNLNKTSLMFLCSSSMEKKTNVIEVITLLIENGTFINEIDKFGNTALHLILKNKVMDNIELVLKILNLLLENKADINLHNDEKQTPLGVACINLENYGYSGEQIIRILLEAGTNVNTPCKIWIDAFVNIVFSIHKIKNIIQ